MGERRSTVLARRQPGASDRARRRDASSVRRSAGAARGGVSELQCGRIAGAGRDLQAGYAHGARRGRLRHVGVAPRRVRCPCSRRAGAGSSTRSAPRSGTATIAATRHTRRSPANTTAGIRAQPPHAQRRRRPRIDSRKDEKKIWMPTINSDAATTARRSSASEPKPCEIQRHDDHRRPSRCPTSANSAAQQQAVLESKARAHAVEPRVPLAHEVRAVGVRAQAQREHLRADDHQQRAADQRVHAPIASEEVQARRRRARRSACRRRRARRRGR